MGMVVRLFFLMIISTVVLSVMLGWVAMMKTRMHLGKAFGKKPVRQKTQDANVIEGEYKVLSEEEK